MCMFFVIIIIKITKENMHCLMRSSAANVSVLVRMGMQFDVLKSAFGKQALPSWRSRSLIGSSSLAKLHAARETKIASSGGIVDKILTTLRLTQTSTLNALRPRLFDPACLYAAVK